MKYLIYVFFSLFALTSFAQDDPMKKKEENGNDSQNQQQAAPWQDKVFFGGNFALQFGNITVIDVSPLVGYRLNEKMQVGAGFTYQYFSRDYGNGYKYSNSIYGGRLFGRYFIAPTLFLHGEYENINLPYWDFSQTSTGELQRAWTSGLLAGGGYSVPLGMRTALNMTVLYNFFWDSQRSASASPWVVRMGFTL